MGIRVNTGTVGKKAATELLSGKRGEALAYDVLAAAPSDNANSAGMALTSAELQKFLESATGTAQAPTAVQAEGPAFAVPTPIAGEFRVNTFTTNDQSASAVTALDGGGFVVTWMSANQDGGGFGIYGQRYTAAGVADGSEFRINTFTANSQIYASASALIGGGFVVTWSSNSQDGSAYGIYGQRYTAAGVADGSEFRVNTFTTGNQIYSAVTTLNSGGFVVTWTSNGQDGSTDGIYGQRYTAAGVADGGEFRVNTFTTSGQIFSAVAALDNGGFVVTWTSISQDGGAEGVYAQRYTSAGVADGSEFRVNTFTTGLQAYSSVTGLDGGGFVVTWSDGIQDGSGYGVYGQRYTAAGVADGGEFRINTFTISTQFFPSVTALNGGGFLVTWSSDGQDGDGFGVYGQRYDAAGVADGAEFRVNETTVGFQFNDVVPHQSVTQLADGSLITTWSGNGTGDTGGVFARRFSLGPVNTAPAGTDATLTITEDTARTLTVADFGFTDADGHALLSVGITTLPAAGTIRLNGVAVTAGTFVTAADINAGLLVYTPGSNGNGAGYSSFTFQVRDNSGATDTDLSANTITFDVTSVNDAPTFSASAALTRVSGLSNGSNADAAIRFEAADISADGTKVVFSSNATNLVAGDANATTDIFLKDLATGAVTRVSTSASGVEGNAFSFDAMLSPDGTKVVFSSAASNLVASDTNGGTSDVFVKTLATGAIERISVTASGFTLNNGGANGIFSPDSSKVAFQANNQIYVKTLSTGVLQLVSTDALGNQGNQFSGNVVFSPDGTKIAFASDATNLVAGDTNGQRDIFVKDLVTGVVTRVSVATDGSQATAGSFEPSFSPDGTKIVFRSNADNLSAADGDGTFDIFVRDLVANTTTLVSADASGIGANGGAQNLTTRAFSPDGSTVYFASTATNLVAGTFGVVSIFGKNLATGAVTLISVQENGTPALSNNFDAITSATGAILFRTDVRLVAGDTDNFYDQYLINPGNLPPTYRENGAPLTVVGAVNVADVDSATYAGGIFSASITNNSVAGDQLTFASSGGATGINVVGNSVQFNGVEIGILTASATTLSVALDSDATDVSVEALTEAVRFASTSENPSSATRTVTFTLVDGGGTANGGIDTASFTRTVAVTSVNDAPSGADAIISGTEDVARTLTATDLGFTDTDGNTLFSVIISTLPTAGTLLLNGNAVTVGQAITAGQLNDNQLVYTPAANANGDGVASFTFRVRDTGGTANGGIDTDPTANTLTFNLTVVNDAPTIANLQGDVSTQTEDDGDTSFADFGRDAVITDVDSANFDGGQLVVAITAGFQTDDTIYVYGDGVTSVGAGNVVTVNGVAIGVLSGGASVYPYSSTLTIDLNSNATVALVQALLRGIFVRDPHIEPTGGVRDIQVTLTDGDGGQSSYTSQLNVIAINDEPFGADATVTINEDGSHVFSRADFGFDAGGYTSGNFHVEENQQFLTVRITTVPNAGTLTLNGVTVLAGAVVAVSDLDAGNLVFTPVANANGAGYASLTFQVQDDGGTTNGGIDTDQSANTLTFNVTAVIDAPVVANLQGDATSFTEGGASLVALDTGLDTLVTDADNANFNGGSLTVVVTGGNTTEDYIFFDDGNPAFGLTFSGNTISQGGVAFATFNAPSSTRTFTFFTDGSATPARVEQLMRSLSYYNSNDYDPVTGAHTVTYTLSDGSGGTSTTTSTVSVISTNDAPVVDLNTDTAGVNDTNLHVEGSFASGIGVTIGITDDGGTLTRATVTITDAIAGDVLTVNLPLPSGITVDPASNATTLILVGNASTSAFATALGQVGYSSTSDNPTAGGTDTSRSITVVVNDGVADSAPATMTMTVAAVNDAPVVTMSFNAPVIDQSALDLSSAHNISSFVQANNFMVSGPTTLNSFTTYLSENTAAIANVFEGFGGTLSFAIYRDNGSGLPGTLITTGVDIAPIATDTGFNLFNNPASQEIFQFVVNLGGVTLPSGNYWLAFHEGAWLSPSDGTDLFWVRSANDTNNNMRANTSNVTAPNGTFATFAPGLAFALVGAPAATEQTAFDLKGKISVADVDAGSSVVTATLSVGYGVIKVNVGTSGATIVSGNNSGTVVLSGTIAQLNALLNTNATSAIRYTANTDTPPGSTTLSVSVNDGGSFGSGGAQTGTSTQTITIIAVNDVPVVDLNGAAAGIDTTASYTENSTPIRPLLGMTISDVDNTTLSGATVSIGTGFVTGDLLRLAGGFSGTTVSGITYSYNNATGVLTLSGVASVADYQTTLAALSFKSNSDDPGTARDITVVVNDGSASSVAAHIALTVTPVNDAPVNTVPGAQSGNEGSPIVFSTANGNALSISDPDAGTGTMRVKLSVEHGTLTLASTSGVTVTGDGTGVVRITGTLSAINAALEGLSYLGEAGYVGPDTLSVTTIDFGNTGSGGLLSDTDSVAITVDPAVVSQAVLSDKLFADDQSSDISAAFASNDNNSGGAGGLDSIFYPVAPGGDLMLGSVFIV